MDPQPPNYHAEFLKSPHHVVLGVLTVGLGLMSAAILPLIAGVTLYALGWIYLPDMPFFRKWVNRRNEAGQRAEEAAKLNQFIIRRESLLRSLLPERRGRYSRLVQVCHDIENAGSDSLIASSDPGGDPRLRKLDELMWTYLRLLSIEQSLEQFLQTEKSDDVPSLLKDAEAEVARLSADYDALKAKGGDAASLDSKQRYLGSRLERLEVLRKRTQRAQQAQSNLELVVSEQDRLDQQIKLLRADAVATKNAETLTARIDATVEHLDQTNKWLSELDEFKDLAGDMPATDLRVGYEAAPVMPTAAAPPVIDPSQVRRPTARQRQSQ